MSEACERKARSLALEKAYVHQVYQQISDATDTVPDLGRAWPKVKQFLSELEPGSLVCDVGCGNGKYLNVNESIFQIGVDRCKRLTEVAREKDHEVLICDNLSLPFRDESFDAVLSIAVVHHFATTDRRVQALRELARVLKIGGKLIISVWAMEQRHRKFESQDVLVPWHRPQQLSTPSLEFTSTTTTTTTTSEDDGPPPYHAYTQTSDSESTRSQRGNSGVRKRGRHWHKGRSIDPSRPLSSSQSSSSLSSPNETCYSFVRRALQKLAGGKRGSSGRHRPWFLDTWTACTKEPPPRRYDPDGCEDIDLEDIQDLPIELRRLEEDTDLPQRRQTFACPGKHSSSIEISLGCKSKSLSDILSINQKSLVRSRSTASNLAVVETVTVVATATTTVTTTTTAAAASTTTIGVITSQPKPKLIKQKQSLCDEEMEEEGGDLPTDMRDLVKRLPEFKVSVSARKQGNVFKQSSMNEELMSTDRLREKEMVRQNIQKQASLNEEFLFRRQRTFDSLRDTFFSTSTARRFQILKDGLTSKIKNSTTGIEKVAGASFKNGFVRILQGWKSETPAYQSKPPPATPPPCEIRKTSTFEEKTVAVGNGNGQTLTSGGERRHSKEDGSDSSKDSSLQSDTSVDSEDSFASVIFIPKQDPNSETSPPTNTSPPSVALTSPTFHSLPQSPQSPKLKGSLPPSPKFKYQSPTSPIIKQPSLPCKYQSPTSPNLKTQIPTSPIGLTKQHSLPTSPKFKYSLPPLSPSFGKTTELQQKLTPKSEPDPPEVTVPQIKEPEEAQEPVPSPLDTAKLKTGVHPRQCFPIVRRSFTSAGTSTRQENLAKPLPKLLSLELFNPETDDVDSDSSGVSSPDSISSVISVLTEELSVESHDTQQTKRSPSDGHSANDSDLNLSDQSLSSLPNSKSPEFGTSKSPENATKSAEKGRNSGTSSKTIKLEAKTASKPAKSPENLSSSSDSLSKSPDLQKESEDSKSDETSKADPSSEEDGKSSSSKQSSSRSPDLLSVKHAVKSKESKMMRKRDEKFVAAASEVEEERASPPRRSGGRSASPSKSLIEAAADVASSLEGAVDAVIQFSPRARRRQLELESTDSKWVVEDYSAKQSPEREEVASNLFKKCEVKSQLKARQEVFRRKSPEYGTTRDEPYPDFKFCKVKCHDKRLSLEKYRSDKSSSIENMPLLGSYEEEGERQEGRRIKDAMRSVETGSSWSLGRSERFYHSLREAENEERKRYCSSWSLNRLTMRQTSRKGKTEAEGKPTVRIISEDESQRRSTRSHSLSLQSGGKETEDRLSESWGEEYRQNLANFADRLSEKLAEEIDQYREEASSKYIYSSLPSGLELMDDPYLTRLSAQLLDLNRLSAELKERNNYLASLSDEDVNKELAKSTNPFLSCSFESAVTLSGNPFKRNNPFLDDSESERSDSEGGKIGFDDSFVPLEIDSPPKKEEEKRLVEGTEEPPVNFEQEAKTGREKRKSLLFVKSASLDDSYKFLGKGAAKSKASKEAGEKKTAEGGKCGRTSEGGDDAGKKNKRVPSWESSMDTDPGSNIHRELSKMTIASSLGYSMESSDPEASGGTGSGSDCSRREISRVTASTASLGHSIESSDPGDASERTGSGSDFSRKETSSADTGRTADSTASGSDCSKDTGYADRRIFRCDGRSSSEETPRRVQLVRQKSSVQEPIEALAKTASFDTSLNGSTSQESLPSDNGGGAITFHRYYHVFREGELDQLIEKYVDNLHIISSYYDHANWCVIAEKVQVWTI